VCCALVAELVDALGLGSSDESCGGSSPSERTKRDIRLRKEFWRECFLRETLQPHRRRMLNGSAAERLCVQPIDNDPARRAKPEED